MSNKLKKLSNKKLMESAISKIEQETGFHIIDKHFGDSYFVFKGDKNSICEFHIKEIPGFRFALWNVNRFDSIQYLLKENKPLWSDNYHISSKSELVFFTQYEKYIDKFKPSHSNFIEGIYREKYDDVEEWYMDSLIDMLNYMKKHRFRSIYYSDVYSRHIWDQENIFYILYTNVKSSYILYKYRRKRKLEYTQALKKCLKIAKHLRCFNCYITDESYCIPRLTLYLRRKDNVVNESLYNKELNKLSILHNKKFTQLDIRYLYDTNKEDKVKDNQCKQIFNHMYKLANKQDGITLVYSNIKR